MPPTEPVRKYTCLRTVLWISLLVLLVLLVLFFAISTLFDLGVWDEFWEMVYEKTGWPSR